MNSTNNTLAVIGIIQRNLTSYANHTIISTGRNHIVVSQNASHSKICCIELGYRDNNTITIFRSARVSPRSKQTSLSLQNRYWYGHWIDSGRSELNLSDPEFESKLIGEVTKVFYASSFEVFVNTICNIFNTIIFKNRVVGWFCKLRKHILG